MLHREDEIAAGQVRADLDTVVDRSPRLVLRDGVAAFRRSGLHPIMLWRYDVGGAATLFLATSNAREGVQLDLLHDPAGRGKYGLRTDVALEQVRAGSRWPALELEPETAYLIRKRFVKRDHEALRALVAGVQAGPVDRFARRVRESFAPRIAGSILALVSGTAAVPASERGLGRIAYRASSLGRMARRAVHPIGCWVEVEHGEGAARAIASRFGRFLAAAQSGQRPGGLRAGLAWWRATVVPVRWRAGLIVSSAGRTSRFPRADLRLSAGSGDIDALSAQIVSVLEERTLR